MKYFLALFCIIHCSLLHAMHSEIVLDQVDKLVLKHYLKVIKKQTLNEDGVNVMIKKTPLDVTLFVYVEDESVHPLADELRKIANKCSKESRTQCLAGVDIVHRSNQDYRRLTLETVFWAIKAETRFTREEFEKLSAQNC